MGRSATRAGAIYDTLRAFADDRPVSEYGLDPAQLANLSQAEIIDLLVDALCPIDGTQDAEASRDSAARALAEVVGDGADLRSPTQAQIDQVIRDFLGNELAHRIALDVGLAIIEKAPSAKVGQQRLESMQDYVREELGRRFDARRAQAGALDKDGAAHLGREVIRDTFEIFEDYL